jgi:hypothetical protein
MPVFLERFLIPLCATALIGVVVLNPMKLELRPRVLLVVLILSIAGTASWAVQKVHKVHSSHNPTVQNVLAAQAVAPVHEPSPIPRFSPVVSPTPHAVIPIKVSGTHFQKMFVVAVGGYQDFTWNWKIRVEIRGIKRATPPKRLALGGEQDHAHIYVSASGGLVYGGEETTREGVNEFLVPISSSEEEARCIFFFHAKDEYFRFFRVLVDHIDPITGEVTLDACFVRFDPAETSI